MHAEKKHKIDTCWRKTVILADIHSFHNKLIFLDIFRTTNKTNNWYRTRQKMDQIDEHKKRQRLGRSEF